MRRTDLEIRRMQGTQYLNQGQDDQMEITGYTHSHTKTAVTWTFIVLTLGFLRLAFYWLPHLLVLAMCRVCSLEDAEIVILKDQYEQSFVSKVQVTDEHSNETESQTSQSGGGDFSEEPHTRKGCIRYFVTKKVKYVWNNEYSEFQKVVGLVDNVTCAYFHRSSGLASQERADRQVYYGKNSIRVHVTPIMRLLFKQVLSPFYIFQVFSCGVWFYEDYVYYAGCIVLISFVSITATIYETRKMQRALRDTIESSTEVTVCDENGEASSDISSEDLVPGDVIEIPRGGCMMQCDAVLIAGNCIVNESMLTGESVPVTKTPLPNPRRDEENVTYFNTKDHSRHVLFSGTHVLQTRYYGGNSVRAVVFRTGFSTAKGELVRSILYPKPVDFRFNKDTYKYIGVLAAIAALGLLYTVVLMVHRGIAANIVIVRALDLVTIAVPPALPAALTVGIVFAQRRMKLAQIYCISPRSINVCGSINTVCFDKTGTLTEEGLDMHSIVPVCAGKFGHSVSDMSLLPIGRFMNGMATCHSLTIIDGALSGDPLELIIFEAIGWELHEPGPEETSRFDSVCPTIVYPRNAHLVPSTENATGLLGSSEEIGIVRQFTFSSSLQRMSVITRTLDADHFDVYTKGAPEMIASLCVPDTVPPDFHEVLMGYTKHGYRVLALAYRQLHRKLNYTKIQRIQREQVECKLTFLGLIVMENRLKPATTPTIRVLKDANIRTIMVTGDNMLTALSVARESQMVLSDEAVLLVQAFPPQTDVTGNATEAPYVDYVFTEIPDKTLTHSYEGFDKDEDLGRKDNYHFAVTGKSWGVICKYFPELVNKIVARGTVFARMSPDQKAQLVEKLQDLDYYVGMCGDGANDCGALKTAHAGISLSEAEASVASPFTSKTADISCVPTVIREGRCALVTSIGVFKYMACYSLTQFISVLILYWVGVNLTDFQFLYVDLFLLTTLSITFGYTAAYPRLSRTPPIISLLSVAPILSLLLQMSIITGFQVLAYFSVKQEPWYVPFVDDPLDDKDYLCYEDSAVFYISMYQYVTLAIAFAKGRPYRRSMLTNKFFMINLFVCFAVTLWINLHPTKGVATFFGIKEPPSLYYKLNYVGGALANLLICLMAEMFIVDSRFISIYVQNKIDDCLPGARPRYESVEEELALDPNWPPVKSEDLAGTFQRLDSAFQPNNTTVNFSSDTDSLTGSDNNSHDGSTTQLFRVRREEMHIETQRDSNAGRVPIHDVEGEKNRHLSTKL